MVLALATQLLAVAAKDADKVSDSLPKTVQMVSMLLGGVFVLAVLAAILVIAGLVANKMGFRPLGHEIRPGVLGVIMVGAMILGSVSGMTLWGSDLYKIDAMPAQEKVKPAYQEETKAPDTKCNFAPIDDQDKAKKLMGGEFDNLKGSWELDQRAGPGDSKVASVTLTYMPKDGNCGTADTCKQIELKGIKESMNAQVGATEQDRWLTPGNFDKNACGGKDPDKF